MNDDRLTRVARFHAQEVRRRRLLGASLALSMVSFVAAVLGMIWG